MRLDSPISAMQQCSNPAEVALRLFDTHPQRLEFRRVGMSGIPWTRASYYFK